MNETMNFNDILTNDFVNNFMFGNLSIIDILLGLLTAFIVGGFIYFVYKNTYKGVLYSSSFNATLLVMTMITCLVIMTISTNVVLSLGMVGALSIVRFRTAIKDPLDIVFMFWAIAAGISSGAGLYFLTFIGAVVIGIVLIIISRKKHVDTMYLLVIHYTEEAADDVKKELHKLNHTLKSKIMRKNVIEQTSEVRLKIDNTAFMTRLNEIEGVRDVSLVQYNGDYAL
ncbi:hypothetical protein KP77_34680 [Jeotgalibacillus alimentarius]|uniref:DUF4956 domain-containing protein n=1 Tax=Jeotgalibacillus alimentarius TaxID=135826 RepID=A0A0C2VFQ0_9BACL|nr:DUF4956 domain-containing protein [Jeotgalibacillus alimentarius]KIL42838.1 hypothetical protein KP77_34680 [Jeotgalibacillus alimentarius]